MSRSENPEGLLSAALHAQAAGGGRPEHPPSAPAPAPAAGRGGPSGSADPERSRLPVGQVLLFAILLGLAAGAILGVLSVL